MLEYAGLPAIEPDYRRWAAFLKKLERLDEAWTGHLIRLENASAAALPDAQEWKLPLEQLLIYLLYRHLPGALEDGELAGRIAFVALMWHILRTMLGIENSTFANFAELCRLYSSEIEYSDENIGAILEELHRAYPEL